MTRRRVLCGLLLLSALLACFASWLWVVNGRKMTRARFEQVREGMSREEVIRTVGAAPDSLQDNYNSVGWDYWRCDEAVLIVRFDYTDTAIAVYVDDGSPPTLTERIRRWLGL
jgi:outer membrane protein assembly factor BamE (lipoprotein component of BamABCDE complex)